ncbi:hypothetical protein F5Y10DRAFT_61608 [Nemania abortiva]|nr:hypothetical protein F5Y10DRAFT_61608 [Nemania abortiva]
MADTQVVPHPTAAWTLFLNSTTTRTTSSMAPSTIPGQFTPSSLLGSIPSATSSPPARLTPTPRPLGPSSPYPAISTLTSTRLSETGTRDLSGLSSVSSLAPDSPLISLLGPVTSSTASFFTASTSPRSLTSIPSSSPNQAATPKMPLPTRATVSQVASTTPLDPSVPTAKPKGPSPPVPPSSEEHSARPVLLIAAIVVSVLVFLLLVAILLGQLRRRGQRRGGSLRIEEAIDPPRSIAGRNHSLVAAYHSVHHGVVRVVVDREAGKGPGMDGLPLYHHGHPNRMSHASDGESGPGPGRWSLGSLGRCDTGAGADSCILANDHAGIGRAY